MVPTTSVASHPYINFQFASKQLPASVWLALGEAMSKCQHLAGVPLKPQLAQKLSAIYLAKGVQATTAIEGNTLSEDEVLKIVSDGSANVPESRAYLEREVANVLSAIRQIDAALREGKALPITAEHLCDFNYVVLDGIPDRPEVVPGKFREHDVAAGPYKAPHWSEVPALVDQFVQWLQQLRGGQGDEPNPESRFTTAVIAAILAHLYIAWIHPFGNGNGRTARLIEVQILSESGVVPIVATNLLSDFYNKTRNAYYLALDRAQEDVTHFIKYAIIGFLDELRQQIAVVREENLSVHWESYVYECFRLKPNTPARDRQREVALQMPADAVLTPDELLELTPDLARRYAICGDRTPARDLNDLVKMGLVERVEKRRYRARRETIAAFMPPLAPAHVS